MSETKVYTIGIKVRYNSFYFLCSVQWQFCSDFYNSTNLQESFQGSSQDLKIKKPMSHCITLTPPPHSTPSIFTTWSHELLGPEWKVLDLRKQEKLSCMSSWDAAGRNNVDGWLHRKQCMRTQAKNDSVPNEDRNRIEQKLWKLMKQKFPLTAVHLDL